MVGMALEAWVVIGSCIFLGVSLIVAILLWLWGCKRLEAMRRETQKAQQEHQLKLLAMNAKVQQLMTNRQHELIASFLSQNQELLQDRLEALISVLVPSNAPTKPRRVGEREVPTPTEVFSVAAGLGSRRQPATGRVTPAPRPADSLQDVAAQSSPGWLGEKKPASPSPCTT